jgi:hypothetical protein
MLKNIALEIHSSAQGDLPPPPSGSLPGHEPSEEHVENLTAKPFWDQSADAELFPWAAELEQNAHIIQEEFEAKLANDKLFSADSVWQNQVMGEG